MNEWADELPLLTAILGGSVALSVISKWGLQRLRLPAAVGWLGIGVLLRVADANWKWLSNGAHEVFALLSTLGVACLLFRVGLQCHLKSLLAQLERAVRIWMADFALSGIAGFCAAHFILHLSVPTSLIIATALTATSVGVSVSAWEQRGQLGSPNGQLMLDVAELDDISGVVAMSVLFALLPVWREGGNGSVLPIVIETFGWFLLKLLAFGASCYLFSAYVEERLTDLFHRVKPRVDPALLILSAGLLIGSLAEYLGLSIAIGAFLAGVMFSRDPEHVHIEASFSSLYAFLTPFFFIGIGLELDLSVVGPALSAGLVLSGAAILGKLVGKWLPGMRIDSHQTAVLLGFSMVPRAEIAMVIVQRGTLLGEWAMPPDVFGAMVVVTLVTCTLSPLMIHWMLGRRSQQILTERESK